VDTEDWLTAISFVFFIAVVILLIVPVTPDDTNVG
jgi:hypothetical protein